MAEGWGDEEPGLPDGGWTAAATVMSFASILRWFFDIFAFVATMASYFKMQTARAAESAARQKLLRRLAWEQFAEMARQSRSLALNVRSGDWRGAAEIATSLQGSLAEASGSWRSLLTDTERDKLKVASRETEVLLRSMPSGSGNVEAGLHQAMSDRCSFLVQALGTIQGRLKYMEDQEGA